MLNHPKLQCTFIYYFCCHLFFSLLFFSLSLHYHMFFVLYQCIHCSCLCLFVLRLCLSDWLFSTSFYFIITISLFTQGWFALCFTLYLRSLLNPPTHEDHSQPLNVQYVIHIWFVHINHTDQFKYSFMESSEVTGDHCKYLQLQCWMHCLYTMYNT